MKLFRSGNLALSLALAWTLIPSLPAHGANQSAHLSKQARKAQKHAQKIEKKLAHYKPGTPIHLVMSDGSDHYGTLGKLSATFGTGCFIKLDLRIYMRRLASTLPFMTIFSTRWSLILVVI